MSHDIDQCSVVWNNGSSACKKFFTNKGTDISAGSSQMNISVRPF